MKTRTRKFDELSNFVACDTPHKLISNYRELLITIRSRERRNIFDQVEVQNVDEESNGGVVFPNA